MPLGAALFLITMIAEVERIPFDMPEAEAELVEGWWTEYGGIRWGLMFAVEMMQPTRLHTLCTILPWRLAITIRRHFGRASFCWSHL